MFQINIQNLDKRYRVYNRPIDKLIEGIFRKPRHRVLNVLQNVSFSLESTRSLGIIGDNGAGKSTLLKILAGTIHATSGIVEVGGRVAALLELGAGFHPEFTGRQNIVLNASLLGISKKEIIKKEQEIIDFSELNEFIDQPVKTYSSGMYIRLAFSIATSVDPDVLIIDEALSVGDISFQRKCIDRMNGFREQGKSMIFCSHSMYHVQELCDKAIWLHKGKIRLMGKSEDVVAQYEDFCKAKTVCKNQDIQDIENKPIALQEDNIAKDCIITALWIETIDGKKIDTIRPLMDCVMKMEVEILKNKTTPQFGFALVMADERIFSATSTHYDKITCGPYNAGKKIVVTLNIKAFPGREGTYRLIGGIAENSGLLWYESKELWPVKVEAMQGLGLATFHHKWAFNIV